MKYKGKCIGYGEHEGKCENKAGSSHSYHWCQRCDDIRRKVLRKKMEKLANE